MTTTRASADSVYDKKYFDVFGGQGAYVRENSKWLEHFGRLADAIVERYHPKRVLDVGCAKGFLVEKLRDRGVEAFGVDASEYAISEVREDVRPFCKVASAAEPFGEKYDLITCIEVVEHMDEADARLAVKNLCDHADQVLFSSTPSDFADETHLCVQSAETWREIFAEHGLYADRRFDPTFITPQATRFVRAPKTKPHVVVFSNEQAKHAVVRLRLLGPLRALERDDRMRVSFVSRDDADLDVDALLDADLFVFHREFAQRKLCERFFHAARAMGKPIVFELDDLLTQVPRSNPNYGHCAAIAPHLLAMLREADFITASTERLREECEREEPAAKGKTFVLTNCIDPEVWGHESPSPSNAGSPLVIGWMGTATHNEDLAVAKTAIAYVLRKHAGRVAFKTWGYMPEQLKNVPGAELARGAQPDVMKHAADLRKSGIDFAIAPLADSPFNHAKSHLKWLEYSICGIPGVYSAITPYSRAIVDGLTGLVVENTTEAWVAALERMIADEDLRIRMARNAYVEVTQHHHLDRAASRWEALYRSFIVSSPEPAEPARADASAALLVEAADRVLRRGHFERGIALLEKGARASAQQGATVHGFAATLSQQGRDSGAERLLVAVAETSDDPRASILALARHRLDCGDPLRAEEALRQGLVAIPRDEALLTALVELLARTGQSGEASRMLRALAGEMQAPEELLALTNLCVKAQRASDALHVVRELRKRFASRPEIAQSCDTLEGTLADAAESESPKAPAAAKTPAAPRVAVLTSEPLTTERACVRLRSPLGILEQRGEISTSWSDGRRNSSCAEQADLVVVQGDLRDDDEARVVVERAAQLGRPVVLELDELSGDGAWFMGRAAAITVPTPELRDALARIEPTLKPRIHVLPDTIDLALWRGPMSNPARAERPLTVALLSDGCATPRSREIVEAIFNSLDALPEQAVVAVFGPLPEDLRDRPSARRLCDSSLSYRELALSLSLLSPDLAIVAPPSAGDTARACDLRWLQCAASRIPCVLPASASSHAEVVHGQTAWLAPDTPSSWVQAIATLAAQEHMRRRLADAAWTMAVGERSAQQHAARWLAVYRTLLAAPAAGGPPPAPSPAPVAVGAAAGAAAPSSHGAPRGKGKRSKSQPSA